MKSEGWYLALSDAPGEAVQLGPLVGSLLKYMERAKLEDSARIDARLFSRVRERAGGRTGYHMRSTR